MARRGKLALVLAVAGLLIAAAFGCGGGDSTGSEGETATRTDAATDATGGDATTAQGDAGKTDRGKGSGSGAGQGGSGGEGGSGSGAKGGGKDGSAGGKSSGGSSGGSGKSSGSGSSGGDSGSSGGGSSGSGSKEFTVPGGDNSVQEFGAEASTAERQAASRVLETYMKARAAEDAQTTCASLSKTVRAQLQDLAKAVPGVEPGASCVAIFTAIDKRTPPSTRANTMTGPISGFRVEGNRGFALYHGTKNTDYTIQMEREGGGWKVGALVPYPVS